MLADISPPTQPAVPCGLVGYGRMGHLIERNLGPRAEIALRVDPKFAGIEASPCNVATLDDATHFANTMPRHWFICTPTEKHLSDLQSVARLAPGASIMVEKPLCAPNDLQQASTLLRSEHVSYIRVNNHYADCRNLEIAQKILSSISRRIKQVEVCFFKDRRQDEESGRFIDRELGVWGYEGFHMLTLLYGLLPEPDRYAHQSGLGVYRFQAAGNHQCGLVSEYARLPSGVETILSTSTNGVCLGPDHKPAWRLRHGERLRRVRIQCDGGIAVALEFGRSRNSALRPGAVFTVALKYASGGGSRIVLSDNPLRRHIGRFLDRTLSHHSELDFAIRLTHRLRVLASGTHSSQTVKVA